MYMYGIKSLCKIQLLYPKCRIKCTSNHSVSDGTTYSSRMNHDPVFLCCRSENRVRMQWQMSRRCIYVLNQFDGGTVAVLGNLAYVFKSPMEWWLQSSMLQLSASNSSYQCQLRSILLNSNKMKPEHKWRNYVESPEYRIVYRLIIHFIL